jgi:hypothetical protein
MATHPYTIVLKKATPTVRLTDGVVKEWEIEVLCTSTENGWKKTFNEREEVEYLNKVATDFTKSELIAMVNVNDHVFDAHWEAHNTAPTTDRVGDFSITNLAD